MAWTQRAWGIACMLISTTCFTGMAGVSKVIGGRATTEEKLLWRSLLSIFFSVGSAASGGWQGAPRVAAPSRPGLLLLRGMCGHIALLAYLEAIELLPLAEAVFLGKIHPFAAAVFSWLFLGERLQASRVGAIMASLVGVALIANPSAEKLASGSLKGSLLASLAGVLSGAAYCCVRALGRADETELWRLLSLPLVSVTCCAQAALSSAPPDAGEPRGREVWLLFLALGLATQGGQVFLSRGLALVPAAVGTQAMYFGSVLGVLLGVLLGDGWPAPASWAGGGLIFASLWLAELAEERPKGT